MNPQIGFLLNKSLESLGNSNPESAELYLKQALRLQAKNPHVLGLLGVVCSQQGRHLEALKYSQDSLKALPRNPLTLSNIGNIYFELKEYQNALDAYDKSLKIDPQNPEAWSNKGNTLQELKRFEEALAHYDQALNLQPNYAEAWSNKGNALQGLKRFEEALTHYDQALNLNPNYAEAWSNKGNALQGLKGFEEAITQYNQALSLKPDYIKGHINKANALNELKQFEEALTHYDKALSLNPNHAEAWCNKGGALHDLGRFDEAIIHHDMALSINHDSAEAWFNKGVALSELKRLDEAIACYYKAFGLNPDFDWMYGHLIHLKMQVASWSGLTDSLNEITKKVLANHKVISPLILLSLNDDPLLHKMAAQIFIKDECPLSLTLGPIPRRDKHKIRIAYFSPDFQNHPVSCLTAELFEIHNREKFEVIAFSLKKAPAGDEVNLRLKKGFDQFIDVDSMSDLEIAQLARELQVDIAIDLTGPTKNYRTGIFAYRAAPIQVNWLGYPGTIGADFIDYIIADKTIIPDSYKQLYSEKVVHLPHTYMVDDSQRIASSKVFTREEFGLPKNSFVFCCFNNGYKFNPQVLDGWSRILLAVQGSVLWISENNEPFRTNIKMEFEKRGINSPRIIFAPKVELMADHLARYALADLFLDTHPYGAHTTAVDSLKAGIPVLTFLGQSFASRVASSLLNAIGLPELITNSQEEYEALAIELAMNPNKLANIKLRLANNRLNAPLFNTPLFTKNIEAAYTKMYERYQAKLQPDHISVL